MSKRLDTIPQLDSLRCLAAFMVILVHYIYTFRLGSFPFGKYGVYIFFVISGYLITAILLEQKDTGEPRLLLVKNFIIKRALRIFPIYYLLLLFWVFLSHVGFAGWHKGDGIYYYTYTSNILFFYKGFQFTQLDHTWTLAVEEQFYLFWPWIILFLPRKKETWIILLLVVFSFIFKIVDVKSKYHFLTVSHFDTLGIGALIACMKKYNHTFSIEILNKFKIPVIIVTSLLLLSESYWVLPGVFHYLCLLVLPAALVIGCFNGFKGVVGYVLNNSAVRYLGKISYGIYLYHMSIPIVIGVLFTNVLNITVNHLVMFVLCICTTILIAHLSYQIIEKIFIRLKTKFDV